MELQFLLYSLVQLEVGSNLAIFLPCSCTCFHQVVQHLNGSSLICLLIVGRSLLTWVFGEQASLSVCFGVLDMHISVWGCSLYSCADGHDHGRAGSWLELEIWVGYHHGKWQQSSSSLACTLHFTHTCSSEQTVMVFELWKPASTCKTGYHII